MRHKREQAADGSIPGSGSSLVVADPPVVARIKGTLHGLMRVAQEGDSGLGKMAFLFDTVAEELIDELSGYDDATMQLYLAYVGQVISWIGHGQNDMLPEILQPFAEKIQPSQFQAEKPEPAEAEVIPEVRELSA